MQWVGRGNSRRSRFGRRGAWVGRSVAAAIPATPYAREFTTNTGNEAIDLSAIGPAESGTANLYPDDLHRGLAGGLYADD